MKSLLIALILAPLAAHAAPATQIECADLNFGGDQGFKLVVDASRESAELSEETFGGLVKVADLSCERPATFAQPSPDEGADILYCQQNEGQHYEATITRNGMGAGLLTATVRSANKSAKVHQMRCRLAPAK